MRGLIGVAALVGLLAGCRSAPNSPVEPPTVCKLVGVVTDAGQERERQARLMSVEMSLVCRSRGVSAFSGPRAWEGGELPPSPWSCLLETAESRDEHVVTETLSAPRLKLAVGEEANVAIQVSGDEPQRGVILTTSGGWAVGELPREGVFLRAKVLNYDPATGTGSVQFEFAFVNDGAVASYACEESRTFRAGEPFEIEQAPPHSSGPQQQGTSVAPAGAPL